MKKFITWGFTGILVAISKTLINCYLRHKNFETPSLIMDIVIAFFIFGLYALVFIKEDSQ